MIAATGTSKKTMRETISGGTRLRAALNMEWPNICAPTIRPRRMNHSRAWKWINSLPEMIAIGSAVIASLLNLVSARLRARGNEEEAQGAHRGGAAPVAAAGR